MRHSVGLLYNARAVPAHVSVPPPTTGITFAYICTTACIYLPFVRCLELTIVIVTSCVMSGCTCPVCSRLFADPRILPCLHTFCQTCLGNDVHPSAGRGVQCPKCLKTFPIQARDLPRDVHADLEVKIAQTLTKMTGAHGATCEGCGGDPSTGPVEAFCADCNEMICQRCWDQHKRHLSLKKHKIVPCGLESSETLQWLLRSAAYRCSTPGHEDEEWSVYCMTCSTLVCQRCIIQDHKDHSYGALDVVSRALREEANAALGRTRDSMAKLTLAIESRSVIAELMESRKRAVTQAITAAFEELESCLMERKKALLAKLESITVPSATAAILQKKEFEKMYKEISEYSERTCSILQTHTDAELAALKVFLPTELQALQKTCENAPLSPSTSYKSAVLSLETCGLAQSIHRLGDIEECSQSHCTWTQTSATMPQANAQYQVRVETRSSNGERLNGSGLQLRGQLISKSHSKITAIGEVEDHKDGTYILTFTLQTAGLHQLDITIEGQHVGNSPSDLYINRDYTANMAITQCFEVKAPNFVSIRENGDIYVSSDVIYVLRQNGGEKLTLGSNGSGDGQFNSPQGIAIHGDMMYVADRYNHRIQKMTTGGQFLQAFGQGQCAGLCIDPPRGRIIAANGQSTVLVFNMEGSLVHSISGAVTGNASFHCPHGVAVDPQGNIHVAARKTSAVKVFTSDGAYIRMYGNLIEPTGIAVDCGGFSLVCEMYTYHISVFDPQGKLVAKIPTQLLKQLGVSVHHDGSVYVSSSDDNVIVKL